MGPVVEVIAIVLVVGGAGFFTAGAVGLLRFPDLHSRLHALTKADNVGLGLVAGGLALTAPSATQAAKLVLLWLIAVTASAIATYLLAATVRTRGPRSGRDRPDADPRPVDRAG